VELQCSVDFHLSGASVGTAHKRNPLDLPQRAANDCRAFLRRGRYFEISLDGAGHSGSKSVVF
jgi:hypothetical protein